jgi:hypothetical protein
MLSSTYYCCCALPAATYWNRDYTGNYDWGGSLGSLQTYHGTLTARHLEYNLLPGSGGQSRRSFFNGSKSSMLQPANHNMLPRSRRSNSTV